MRVNPILVPIFFILVLLGSVWVAQGAGMWSTSGRSAATLQQMTPADIKGWMTLQQVIDGVGILQAELYALVNVPPDVPASTALKDLEGSVPGFEITVLREALTAKLNVQVGTPVSAPTPTPTPPPAATLVATDARPSSDHATPTPLPAGQVLPGSQVKGRMTLREVSEQCATPLDALLSALSLPADVVPNTALRDLIAQGKLSDVAAVQQAVTALQSK